MKLLFCPNCTDIRALNQDQTHCVCRQSWGRYVTDPVFIGVEYGGKAMVLGIENKDIANLMTTTPPIKFAIYRIQENASTIRRIPLRETRTSKEN